MKTELDARFPYDMKLMTGTDYLIQNFWILICKTLQSLAKSSQFLVPPYPRRDARLALYCISFAAFQSSTSNSEALPIHNDH